MQANKNPTCCPSNCTDGCCPGAPVIIRDPPIDLLLTISSSTCPDLDGTTAVLHRNTGVPTYWSGGGTANNWDIECDPSTHCWRSFGQASICFTEYQPLSIVSCDPFHATASGFRIVPDAACCNGGPGTFDITITEAP